MRIAVVGAGVSGLVSAYLLSKAHEVELFERNAYLGGHANTVRVEHELGPLHLDTGFVVFNQPAYPRFSRLLDELGVASQASDMSFSVSCRACRLGYSSRGLAGWLANPTTMLQPRGIKLAYDVLRFYRDAPRAMDDAALDGATLRDYLKLRGLGDEFRRHFIVPLAAAVWSMPPDEIETFPACYLLRFLYNHGLVGGDGRWAWRTVTGGSRAYVEAIVARLCTARRDTPVRTVQRHADGVSLRLADGSEHDFDSVVLACHADEALALIGDASGEEEAALRAFSYTKNSVVLHTDASFLPSKPAARASWNYQTEDCRQPGSELALTYYLNRLQTIDNGTDYCVSVNATRTINPTDVIQEIGYTHPRYTFRTLEGQRLVTQINGSRHTYFAGAHLGYGFHEDGVESAYRVAALLGVEA